MSGYADKDKDAGSNDGTHTKAGQGNRPENPVQSVRAIHFPKEH